MPNDELALTYFSSEFVESAQRPYKPGLREFTRLVE